MFWKKKPKNEQKSNIILAMIMLADTTPVDMERFRQNLREHFSHEVEGAEGDTAHAFSIDGEMIGLMLIPMPIPPGEIEASAPYAYNWQTVLEDSKNQQAHIIVSMMSGSTDMVKRYKIFTAVVASLLRATNAIGVYKGSQTLLIPKDQYLQGASEMSDDDLPLMLWIYIGLRLNDDKASAYTYGLTQFNKTEMEIVDSNHSLEELADFLLNISHYVLQYDVTFRDGETCGHSEDEKFRITYSKAKYIDGKSFKLAY